MQFTNALLALALVATPIFAAPTAAPGDSISSLNARANTIICKPNKNTTPVKTFKVDVDHAIAQAKFAGFKGGASSYPHGFGNVEKIKWNVQNCDAKDAILNEYPVYWDTAKKDWEKEKKTNAQGKTPIRVVYANKNGGVVYCGLMVHTTVEGKDFAMSRDFKKCE